MAGVASPDSAPMRRRGSVSSVHEGTSGGQQGGGVAI